MARRPRRSAEEQLADQLISQALSTPAGRKFALVALIIGALAFSGYWLWENKLRPRHPVGPTVRLATWNLRQFSEDRKHVNLSAIASIIQKNQFDLVAIQEVKRDGEEVDRLVQTLGVPWKAARFSETSGNYERFAFIYNSDHVQETSSPHTIASTDAVTFDRWPYQDSFKSGNFKFTLIEVHLSYTNTERRQKEAQTLASFAQHLQSTQNDDVIICGDFNEQPPNGNLHYFEEIGWDSLNHDPSNLGNSEVYDTFLIDPHRTREWNGTSASVHFNDEMFPGNNKSAEDQISDHRPAYADFVTNLPQ